MYSSRKLLNALVAPMLALASCGDTGEKTPPEPKADNPFTFSIGLIATLSGQEGSTGQEARLGAQLAVSQINAAGGVLGRELRLVVKDDEGNPAKALAAVNELVAANVTLIVGPTTNASAQAVVDVARRERAVMISPSAGSPALDVQEDVNNITFIQPNLLRAIPKDTLQAAALAVVAAQTAEQYRQDPSLKSGQARCKKIMFVHEKSDYGDPILDGVRREANSRNLSVASRTFELDVTRATDQSLQEAANAIGALALSENVDCQVVIAQAVLGGGYMRAWRAFVTNPANSAARDWSTFTTLGSDGFTQDSFITSGRVNRADPTSESAGNGSIGVAANTRPATQEFADFEEIYRARYIDIPRPGRFAPAAYDSVVMLSLAVEQSKGVFSNASIRKTLGDLAVGEPLSPSNLNGLFAKVRAGQAVNYQGVSGAMDFLGGGAVDGDFVFGRVVNNVFVPFNEPLRSSTLR
jgi:ABC-type branched-subunit amino acid transport system substrate-binding protein